MDVELLKKIKEARYGNDSILDRLVSDPDPRVRIAVAYRGRDEDLDILLVDKVDAVRLAVAEQGRGDDLAELADDDSDEVRMTVAKLGGPNLVARLLEDPVPAVRKQAVLRTHTVKTLKHMLDDPDEEVRRTAKKKLVRLENENDYDDF